MIRFDPRLGRFELRTPLFHAAQAAAGVNHGNGVTPLDGPWCKTAGGHALTKGDCAFLLDVRAPSRREAAVRLQVASRGHANVFVDSLVSLLLPADTTRWVSDPDRLLHYVHCVNLSDPYGVKLLTRKASWAAPFARSAAVTALYDPQARQAVLMGALPDASSFTLMESRPATPEGRGGCGWTVSCDIRAELAPGRSFSTGTVLLLAGEDPLALLEEYGDRWAEMSPPTRKAVRIGWNSWDYYSGSVRRQDVDENLDAASKAFGGRLKTWVIDEGWEAQWGVWLPNLKFPQGMADYCKRVRDAGGEPGIWTAPLCMNIYSPHARYHQDWFLRNARNQPIMEVMAYGYIAYLDPTREDVLRWLAEVFGRLREWGFAYYKLDFLAFVFSAHRYHDPTVPRGEVLRRAVKAIRDTVGPDAYVMAMPHFESLHGLLDAARIAGDIHNFWGHIRQNAVAAGVHYWKHGRIWNNDVDFAITRCAELSDDPHLNRIYERRPLADDYWFAGPEANLEECRTWLNICYLSAGEMILGDRLSRLSPQGIAMLRRVLDRLPAPARPLDLFSADCPSPRWRADTPQGHVMGYFNWQDHPVSMAVDPADWGGGRCRLRDFWTGESLPSGGFTLDLPPHHSRLIEVTVKRPKR